MTIRPLREEEIESATALSTQAGWNHAPADWRRLLRLWPGQCLVGEVDGRIVASGSLATYPSGSGLVGWVGLILVDGAHRRKGFGTRIMEAILELGARVGVSVFGLDASDQGEPIYRKLGFACCSEINRWAGMGVIRDSRASLSVEAWDAVRALDREATGVDRWPLLREFDPATRWLDGGGRLRGFGCVRPGRVAWHLGPICAADVRTAEELCDELFTPSASGDGLEIIVDVLAGSAMEGVLARRGFAVTRRLKRMGWPGPPGVLMGGDRVFAISGFELG